MYEQHFGLHQPPFALTPDTGFFFRNEAHVEALEVLRLALAQGAGFIKVSGEVGTGKTLLCRLLLNSLDENWVTAWVPNPHLDPDTLRRAIADELRVSLGPNPRQHTVVKKLQERLIELAGEGKRVAVIIDEAQALSNASLEALRLLSNLETETRKLLHVVLFGQPELDARLAQPQLRQLQQRIGFAYVLRPLDAEGVALYLQHRLAVAGHNGRPLFGPVALRRLHHASRGIPRLLNVLAHKALLLAYGRGLREVGAAEVELAVRDTESASSLSPPWWRARPMLWAALAAALLLGLTAAGWGWAAWAGGRA
ncbi:AAA family ATPase [Silanimonas sp.]|uniref:ExeA family protein n=1 Tax=Silanimonas sp. TaxID=1929290 RepID=UPI001BB914B8|nr:AAA family ATPase [Silanimonas sp.]MBS3896302.1 AAA family ATPase [Silanimonas sp.]